jgi:hypothetical protein
MSDLEELRRRRDWLRRQLNKTQDGSRRQVLERTIMFHNWTIEDLEELRGKEI